MELTLDTSEVGTGYLKDEYNFKVAQVYTKDNAEYIMEAVNNYEQLKKENEELKKDNAELERAYNSEYKRNKYEYNKGYQYGYTDGYNKMFENIPDMIKFGNNPKIILTTQENIDRISKESEK